MKGGIIENKMFKTNSKGQSEIITTVLIILLVLAAIIIVWQVVSSTIEEGEQNIEQTSQCIGIDVAMIDSKAAKMICIYDDCDEVRIVNSNDNCPSPIDPSCDGEKIDESNMMIINGNITLRRDSNEPEGKNVTVIVLVNEKKVKNTASLDRFSSRTITITNAADDLGRELVIGDEISVAYTVDGEACPNAPEVLGKVTA